MRRILAVILMLVSAAAWPQVRTAKGQGVPKPAATPKAAHNSTARDTTPFNCDQYRSHPHPGMVGFCQSVENMALQNEAHRAGRPAPSSTVIRLPGLGTAEAKQLGYACVGGQAFKRLGNGWEQVHATEGGWQRCQGG